MKIAVSGTYSVGKSTLSSLLSLSLGLPLIKESPREILELVGAKAFEDAYHDSFQLSVMYLQQTKEKILTDFVTDITFFEMFAYCRSHEESYEKIQQMIATCKYDYVFYIPVEIPLELDGLRVDNDSYRMAIDDRIKEIYTSYGIKYYTITGTRFERLSKCMAILEQGQRTTQEVALEEKIVCT